MDIKSTRRKCDMENRLLSDESEFKKIYIYLHIGYIYNRGRFQNVGILVIHERKMQLINSLTTDRKHKSTMKARRRN